MNGITQVCKELHLLKCKKGDVLRDAIKDLYV
jgi:hypothetical protein